MSALWLFNSFERDRRDDTEVAEKSAESGNGRVFRGSVQLLRLVFPDEEIGQCAWAQIGMPARKT
jgi:hypothetical protein